MNAGQSITEACSLPVAQRRQDESASQKLAA